MSPRPRINNPFDDDGTPEFRRRVSGGNFYRIDGTYRAEDLEKRAKAQAKRQENARLQREELARMREKARIKRLAERERAREIRQHNLERAREQRLKMAERRLDERMRLLHERERTFKPTVIHERTKPAAVYVSRTFIPLDVAAREFNVPVQQLDAWAADGLLDDVEILQNRNALSPQYCKDQLASAIERLSRTQKRRSTWNSLRDAVTFDLPHVHRYTELRVEPAWSNELRREILVSQQRCDCGNERQALRVPMRVGSRTIAIQQVPRGTWDIEVEGVDAT